MMLNDDPSWPLIDDYDDDDNLMTQQLITVQGRLLDDFILLDIDVNDHCRWIIKDLFGVND